VSGDDAAATSPYGSICFKHDDRVFFNNGISRDKNGVEIRILLKDLLNFFKSVGRDGTERSKEGAV
jgi:hypothetical protein